MVSKRMSGSMMDESSLVVMAEETDVDDGSSACGSKSAKLGSRTLKAGVEEELEKAVPRLLEMPG
jgi:hypothetical protein